MRSRTDSVPPSRASTASRSTSASRSDPYSGLEEAKADIVGIYGLEWLMDRGVLPKERAREYYASYVAGIFRTVRFGRPKRTAERR